MKMEAEIGVYAASRQGMPKIASERQKLRKRYRMESSLEPSERAWSCRHLDFGHLASRTMRE